MRFWVIAVVLLLLLALGFFLGRKLLAKGQGLPGYLSRGPARPVSRVDQLLRDRYRLTNKQHIDSLNPAVRAVFESFIRDIEDMGYSVALTSSYRSFQKQAELKKLDARNASPGFSSHNYGTALDLVLIKNGVTLMKDSPLASWLATGVVKLAKEKYGMRWGGEFPGYHDAVHFDLNNKYDTKKLYAAAVKKYGSPERVRGNELDLDSIV